MKLHWQNIFKVVLAVTFALASFLNVYGQGWERVFGGSNSDIGYSVIQTIDGGFAAVGESGMAVYLIRLNPEGQLIWEKELGQPLDDGGRSLVQAEDGGFIIVGSISNAGAGGYDVYMLKADANGNLLWEQTFGGVGDDYGRSVSHTSDGGYIITGCITDPLFEKKDVYLIKTDAEGNQEWAKTFGGTDNDEGRSVVQTEDGSFVIVGYTKTISNSKDILLVKTNADGNQLWSYTFGGSSNDEGYDIDLTEDGGFIITGYTNPNGNDIYLLKTDSDGSLVWSNSFSESPNTDIGYSVAQTPDGGYVICGYTDVEIDNGDVALIRTDAVGELLWSQQYGRTEFDEGYDVVPTSDGGYIITGSSLNGILDFDLYMIKTDSLGNTHTNAIKGNVFYDFNLNCTDDGVLEPGIAHWMIEVSKDSATVYYGTTDEQGNYEVPVDTGTYEIRLIIPNDYWAACPTVNSVSFNEFYDTTQVVFPVQATLQCPLLKVDVSTPLLRRCFDNTYSVSYCNQGTSMAQDAFIEVTFDEYLVVIESTLPWSNQNGNTYTFDLGNVLVGQCEQFYIETSLDCDAADIVLGQTHCVEAHIYPDSICTPPSLGWDGSSVTLSGVCTGDSVKFQLQNVGASAMSQQLEFIVIEDHVLGREGNFQLGPSEGIFVTERANGGTFRLIAEQADEHPGISQPTIAIEGCGTDTFSIGYVTQYPEDDANPFVSLDCQENIGSFDPNDKRGYPIGYEEEHLIAANTDLEYIIRFQNTGTDTAFTVVIRDTLPLELDPTSIQLGAGSHPYIFEAYGSGILKFTFDDILLPDSSTNEILSHGFVKFRISQKLNNPEETIINNSAAIYFDYNEPVVTASTTHKVGGEHLEDFIEVISSYVPEHPRLGIEVRVYPNPFVSSATVEVVSTSGLSSIPDDLSFRLYNTSGRLLWSMPFEKGRMVLDRDGLPTGMYFYRIESPAGLLDSGKVVVH